MDDLIYNPIIYQTLLSYFTEEDLLNSQNDEQLSKSFRESIQQTINDIQLNDQLSIKRQLYLYCKKRYVIRLKKLIDKYQNDLEWNYGLSGACCGGHRDLAELMISKGASDWDWGLYSACYGGHHDLVERMIQKGANHWNYGLQGACRGGNRDLAERMISKGANDLKWGFYEANCEGHRELAQLMIQKGADGSFPSVCRRT